MKDSIRNYLCAHAAAAQSGAFSDDESLIEAGIIDSVTMVDLIAHLEQAYGIRIPEEDMTPENFDSLNAIVNYVASRK